MRLLILLITCILISGCVSPSVSGVYVSGNSKLVLQDDWTYIYYPVVDGAGQKGTFSINNDELQITNIFGMTTILFITKDGLLDDEGNVWKRL